MFGISPDFFLPLLNLNENPYILSAMSINYTGFYSHLHMNFLKMYSGKYNVRPNMTENRSQKQKKMFPCQQIAAFCLEINNSMVS